MMTVKPLGDSDEGGCVAEVTGVVDEVSDAELAGVVGRASETGVEGL